MSKFLDSNGVSYLYNKLSLQDYPNNETLSAVIKAIDETKADKATTPELDSSTGMVKASQIPTIKNTYSTSEQVVGEWIDGKAIYRKTITFSQNDLASDNHWARYNDSTFLSTIDQVIHFEGTTFVSSKSDPLGAWQTIPRIVPDACSDYSIGIGDFNGNYVGVLFGTLYYSASKIYLTIDYTKK